MVKKKKKNLYSLLIHIHRFPQPNGVQNFETTKI